MAKIQSRREWNCMVWGLVACFLLQGALANGPCPLSDPNFSGVGVSGTIAGSLPNGNTLYAFGNSGPKDAVQCYRACKNWPTFRGVTYTPQNGDKGPCAFWVWKGRSTGCFLLGCNTCKSFSSFDTQGTTSSCSVAAVDHYCSGSGPGINRCFGGVKGDPHYTGGDQSHFEFTGEPGNDYCLVSDSNFHINVHYGGRFDRWGDSPRKPLTWIRKVAILYGEHTVVFSARPGPEWQYGNGYMESIVVDGKSISLSVGESLSFAHDEIKIRWVSAKKLSGHDEIDVYEIFVGSVLHLVLKLRPEVSHLRTNEDGIVHFSLDFPILQLSDNGHGILGQTYRADHSGRIWNQTLTYSSLLEKDVVVGDNAEGFLDGVHTDYMSSNLLTPDCAMSRFSVGGTSRKDNAQSFEPLIQMNSRKLRL